MYGKARDYGNGKENYRRGTDRTPQKGTGGERRWHYADRPHWARVDSRLASLCAVVATPGKGSLFTDAG